MTQTIGGMSFANPKFEIAPDSAGSAGTYVDYTGQFATIEVSGGERAHGEQHTGDGDVPIIVAGKRSALTIKVKAVYTEVNNEITDLIRTNYEAGTPVWLRWSPTEADTSGDHILTASSGIIKNPVYPQGDVGSAEVMMIEFDLVCAQVTKSEVA